MPRTEKGQPQNVCLFGGTFDPIHMAHLRIAEEARKRYALDRILFVPAGNPPHKEAASVTPYEDRYRMVEIACKPYAGFVASRLEAGERPSYTVDTVKRVWKDLGPKRPVVLSGGRRRLRRTRDLERLAGTRAANRVRGCIAAR